MLKQLGILFENCDYIEIDMKDVDLNINLFYDKKENIFKTSKVNIKVLKNFKSVVEKTGEKNPLRLLRSDITRLYLKDKKGEIEIFVPYKNHSFGEENVYQKTTEDTNYFYIKID